MHNILRGFTKRVWVWQSWLHTVKNYGVTKVWCMHSSLGTSFTTLPPNRRLTVQFLNLLNMFLYSRSLSFVEIPCIPNAFIFLCPQMKMETTQLPLLLNVHYFKVFLALIFNLQLRVGFLPIRLMTNFMMSTSILPIPISYAPGVGGGMQWSLPLLHKILSQEK